MGGEIDVKTIVYNMKRDKKEREKRKEREKGGRNTTVKERNSVLSILLLRHDR